MPGIFRAMFHEKKHRRPKKKQFESNSPSHCWATQLSTGMWTSTTTGRGSRNRWVNLMSELPSFDRTVARPQPRPVKTNNNQHPTVARSKTSAQISSKERFSRTSKGIEWWPDALWCFAKAELHLYKVYRAVWPLYLMQSDILPNFTAMSWPQW